LTSDQEQQDIQRVLEMNERAMRDAMNAMLMVDYHARLSAVMAMQQAPLRMPALG
jgi:hypothetical protein